MSTIFEHTIVKILYYPFRVGELNLFIIKIKYKFCWYTKYFFINNKLLVTKEGRSEAKQGKKSGAV